MERVALAVAGAFVLGALAGSVLGVGAGFVDGPHSDDSAKFDPPGASLSKSVGECDDFESDSGWVHDVAVGESFAVTLDATVVHDPSRSVTANVSRSATGPIRIDLRTTPADEARENGTEAETDAAADERTGCAATDLSLATSLPTDYEEFEVSVNGRTLRTVENDGTTADLHRLPTPINATEG